MDMIEKSIKKLIRGTGRDLSSYLREIHSDKVIHKTKARSYCNMLKLDGNGRPRVEDFAEFISMRLVDYAIPRSEIEKAKKKDTEYNSTVWTSKLTKKAVGLFTHLKNSGEGGEVLLYILVQEILKIPQLLCKMPLKTNSEMHYHGVDGIHVEFDKGEDKLALYWGESKLYQDVDQGIASCFKSLKGFFETAGGSTATQERDVQLIRDNIDLLDSELEDAIVNYLDKDHPNFNKMEYRGVCLIGFDSDKYPTKPNSILEHEVEGSIKKEIDKWQKSLSTNIIKAPPLDQFILHVFLLPFPNVQDFRTAFLKEIGV